MNVTKNLIENYKLFQKIQINKYLKTFNKTDFSDTIERFHVLQKIRNKFQTSVISEIDRFKTELEKKEFFKSINIDFYSEQIDEETENRLEITLREIHNTLSTIFPFISNDKLFLYPFIGLPLEAYGLPFERFRKIIMGKTELAEIEKDMFIWAFDLADNVMKILTSRKKSEREKAVFQAMNVAKKELDEKKSAEIIYKIISQIFHLLNTQKE
jgi:hypothetical protein